MFQFAIRFFICNIFIAGGIFVFLCLKYFFKKYIPTRTQYNLWFLILGLLIVPFVPFHFPEVRQVFQLMKKINDISVTDVQMLGKFDPSMSQVYTAEWANDFAVSVSRDAPSILGVLLCSIWMIGIIVMILLVIHSWQRLNRLKKSALPLQNRQVFSIFEKCKTTLHITSDISIYSTAFLKSPITVGVLHPQIYIPLHMISDFNENDIRYILLHELQHYKYKDAIPNCLMNIVGILYWFNPVIWYALKEMRTDREVACDSAVLKNLTETDYRPYGNTLINFVQKISLSPFPFVSGLGGSMKQIKKRIINIASYQPHTRKQNILGISVYSLIAILLLGFAPLLSTYATEREYYHFESNNKHVTYIDLSSYFQDYNGTFVLYGTANDTWNIYNKELATMRVAPDSTYKIYEGLMGLEYGAISPEQTSLVWDGTNQPFASWNSDQTLNSAMHNSVNWYFETIEGSIGYEKVQNYLNEIGYGNRNMSSGTSYWMESSLKISPIEQVELLKNFNANQLSVNVTNTNIIKNAIQLSSNANQSIYGKTGTGRVNGQDINGWFIGYIEKQGQVYYFATNIQSEENATGQKATEITQSILNDLQIWN